MSDKQLSPVQDSLLSKIKLRAYEIWEQEGCAQGHDLEHWVRAETEVASESEQPEETAETIAVGKKK